MQYFNLKHYSYYDFLRKYKHYKKVIKNLKLKVTNYQNHKLDSEDEVNSLQQALNNREQQISGLKQIIMDNTHIKPQPKVLDSQKVLIAPSNYSTVEGDGLPTTLTSLQLDKGSRYTISCTVPMGERVYITQYPTSENNSVKELPSDKDTKYVTFIGKSQDDGNHNHIILNFQSNVSDTLFLGSDWSNNIKNYSFTQYEEPYNNPRFPYYDIPYPNTDTSNKTNKVNNKVITLLQNLLDGLKNGKLDIPDINYNEDENGDISYSFTADSIKPKYTFIKAMNQLNDTNGMKRASSNKDYWIAIDANGNLYKKYRGSDKLVPYQPSYKDINAKDWEVLQIQPYNPNTKPYGSDNWDDLNDTNNFGYDGNTDADGDY